jgi:hypothetical protein
MRIDSSGNVGIGTSSVEDSTGSSTRLQVQETNGGSDVALRVKNNSTTSGSTSSIRFTNTTTTFDHGAIVAGRTPSSYLAFEVSNGSEAMRIDSSGNAKINDGNLIIGTNGHGIDFSASEGSGSSSSILDDYEEGTFTPAYDSTIGTTTVSYTEQSGDYVKIGNMVFVRIKIVVNVVSATGDGILYVNLPFTVANQSGNGWTGEVGWNGSGIGWSTQPFNLAVILNTSRAYFHSLNMTNGIIADLAPSALGNGCLVEATIKYQAA